MYLSGFPLFCCFLNIVISLLTHLLQLIQFHSIKQNKYSLRVDHVFFTCVYVDGHKHFGFSTTTVGAQPSLCCVWLCSIRNTPSNETARY